MERIRVMVSTTSLDGSNGGGWGDPNVWLQYPAVHNVLCSVQSTSCVVVVQ